MEGNRKGKIAKELHRIAALIFFLLFSSPPPFFPLFSRINFLSTKFLLLRIHLHVISEQLIVSIIGGRTLRTDARKVCFNINFLSLILADEDENMSFPVSPTPYCANMHRRN